MTKEELLEVAKIARISIKESEAGHFAKELNDVLKFVDMINEVKVEGEICSIASENK